MTVSIMPLMADTSSSTILPYPFSEAHAFCAATSAVFQEPFRMLHCLRNLFLPERDISVYVHCILRADSSPAYNTISNDHAPERY